ncbi:helix-turn-helix domain-containing protein [Actinosynnema sp. NPDC059797]
MDKVCTGWRTDAPRAAGAGARLQAGERFARGEKTTAVAAELRVGVRQVEKWRRSWREGGMDALRSAGPMSVERLSPVQWERLERALAKGPLAHGWDEGRG